MELAPPLAAGWGSKDDNGPKAACCTVSGNRGKVFSGMAGGSWPNETSWIRKRQECLHLTIASSTVQRHSAFWKFRLRGHPSDMKASFS